MHYNTPTRIANRKPPISVDVIATDNFGDSIARCELSGKVFNVHDGVVRGNYMAQANMAWLHAPGTDEEFKALTQLFHENDANCNTCKSLQRLPNSNRDGFLSGKCLNPKRSAEHPYSHGDEMLSFHPDDWMGMSCYKPRWSAALIEGNT